MQSHSTGVLKGNRNGSIATIHSFEINDTNNPNGSNVKLCTLGASAQNPIVFRVWNIVVSTSDAVTSDAIQLGTTSSGTQLAAGIDLKASGGVNSPNANGASPWFNSTADISVWVNRTVVGAVTAPPVSYVLVECIEINKTVPSTLGI